MVWSKEGCAPREFGCQRSEVYSEFLRCGRVSVERISINLAVSALKVLYLEAGFWLAVESGGSSSVVFTPKQSQETQDVGHEFPLPTRRVVPGPWAAGVIRIPTGLTGTLVLLIAKFDVPLPKWNESLLVNSAGTPISSSAPLPVAVPNRSTFVTGQKTVAVPGVPEPLGAGNVPDGFAVVIKAKSSNAGKVYVGVAAVLPSTGFILEGGESCTLYVSTLGVIFLDVEFAAEGVSYMVEA